MNAGFGKLAAAAAIASLIAACQQQPGSTSGTGTTTAGSGATTAGGPTGTTGTTGTPATGSTGTTGTPATGTTGGSSIPALVNVNLQNVLNNLSVALKVDRANIPVNAQVPIDVAANVCGVSVNVLAAAVASGKGSCTATTTSPQLTQLVQQQVAAGGNVGGGPQTTTGATTNNMI